jgi:hypothetical protein
VVLRLLSLLEWDIFNVEEICPDFTSEASTVSYALRIDHTSKVILDVKRDHEDMDGLHKQLVDLAVREAFELCVHTDGQRWWFYLPSAKGALSQKRCHVIDLIEQKPEDAAADLMAFLSREKVAGGGHLEAAITAHQSQKRKMAAEFLPGLEQGDGGAEQNPGGNLSDAHGKLCGCRADPGWSGVHPPACRAVASERHRGRPGAAPAPGKPPSHHQARRRTLTGSDIKAEKPEFFADKSINSFTFQGNALRSSPGSRC